MKNLNEIKQIIAEEVKKVLEMEGPTDPEQEGPEEIHMFTQPPPKPAAETGNTEIVRLLNDILTQITQINKKTKGHISDRM